MIDIRKLKELVRLMVANELTELDLRDEQQQVSIKRPDSSSPAAVSGVPGVPMVAAPVAPAVAPAAVPPPAPAAPAEEEGLVTIESPMVGTFYSKPSPDKPSFISAGDSVTSDSVVCLIEAMKIFNEIKAEQSGTVVKILLNNGDSVEFGQPILLIRPS
jgi:acetyl-CoA carboxylase biotin carboxyl carrier protein